MKQRKFPGGAPILILLFGIGLSVVWFFARLGGAVDAILRENMKRCPGNIASRRKADQIGQAEERCQSIGLQRATGNGSEFYFDLPATSNRLKA
jgi:hypothetical protein